MNLKNLSLVHCYSFLEETEFLFPSRTEKKIKTCKSASQYNVCEYSTKVCTYCLIHYCICIQTLLCIKGSTTFTLATTLLIATQGLDKTGPNPVAHPHLTWTSYTILDITCGHVNTKIYTASSLVCYYSLRTSWLL